MAAYLEAICNETRKPEVVYNPVHDPLQFSFRKIKNYSEVNLTHADQVQHKRRRMVTRMITNLYFVFMDSTVRSS